jgi:hypothetical protein
VQVLSLARFGVVSHYCGGRVIETRLFLGSGSATCGMEKDKNSQNVPELHKTCCKNVVGKLEIPSAFEVAHRMQIANADYHIEIPIYFTEQALVPIDCTLSCCAYNTSPPHPPDCNLSRLQVFRI